MDARTIIEGLAAVAMFFAAFWIRGMREDFRELVKTVNNHGERLAVVESKVERAERWVERTERTEK